MPTVPTVPDLLDLLDVITARRTPWLRSGDRWLTGPELLGAPARPAGEPRVELVVERTGAAAALATALRLVSVGHVPVLWPGRVEPPEWLRSWLGDGRAAYRAVRGVAGTAGLVGVCSSGTTGTGKVVFLDQRRAVACARAVADRLGPAGADELVVSTRGIGYSAGFVPDALGSLCTGAALCHPPVAPEFLPRLLAAEPRAVSLHCTGAVAERLLATSLPPPRRVVLSGDLLGAGTVASIRDRWPDTAVWHGYGLAEAGPRVALGAVGGHRTGELPEPLPGVELSVEEGELVVSTPYAGRAVLDRGGLRPLDRRRIATGDLADGTVLRGRRSATFAVGGSWVQADLVEAELREHGMRATVSGRDGGWRVTVAGGLAHHQAGRADVRRLLRHRFPFLPAPEVVAGDLPPLTAAGKVSQVDGGRP